ncbi:MAG: ABC transporter ATP-binding protein [Lachnospiraceae bacterium]|nr:ABC transporter ATP-binding protein [Lachnospiraceae bacterium]
MLELRELRKCYGKKEALKGANIKFDKGIYGLLGPNGAGKSTMMNIITDVLEATSGEVLYDDVSIKKMGSKYRKKIAYLPQRVGFYPDFTARRTLEYFAMLRGVDKKDIEKRIEYSLSAVNLTDSINARVGTFSGGMKQRLGIATALVSDPEILIFDEPTVGLDPKERIKFRKTISELAKEKTIILSTHIVSDVESIADYIVLLRNGEVIGDGTKEEIIKLVEKDMLAKGENANKTDNENNKEMTLEDVYMYFYDEKSEE